MNAIGTQVLSSLWNNAFPLSLLGGAAAGAKIGLNLCTIWAPIPTAKASSFCLFYIMPQCALIGLSLVFITYVYGIESLSGIATYPEEQAESAPTYIEDTPGDGDCLLHAALKHIQTNRKFYDPQAAFKLRTTIANAALITADQLEQQAIIHDIAHAREIATQANETNALPFSHLFTPNMNNVFIGDPPTIAWNPVIGQAYKDYLLTPTPKAYLDQYAIRYLNKHLFRNRLLIVQPNQQGRYINKDAAGFNIQDLTEQERSTLPILLKVNEHYQYIDSSDPTFWDAYTPTS
ncbi:MAG: hypothetical protein LVR00_00235 [Rhabdochlamydiaceae bacterium]|jgi:hypothetical protein